MSNAFVIGVTGTKGKTTTASLIYHILKTKYKSIFLAGNIGISPLELLSKIKRGDKVVLELSSFGLEGLTKSPDIAVVTNIMPDHLNKYATMAEYIEAKKSIFIHQKPEDILIINSSDFIVRQFARQAKSKIIFFNKVERPDGFKLLGEHNLLNLSAAVEVARVLKVSEKNIKKSVKSFKGVPNRQEFVKEVGGVKYFNDTTATMPEATISAIKSFSDSFLNSKIILICGGQNKGLDYKELIKVIKEKVDNLIMLPGTASDKIMAELKNYDNLRAVFSMDEAVKMAKELSKKGDIVVLSPAAASFNLFKNGNPANL